MLSKETETRIYYHTRTTERSNSFRNILLFAIAIILALILANIKVLNDTMSVLLIDYVTEKENINTNNI